MESKMNYITFQEHCKQTKLTYQKMDSNKLG